MKIHIVGCSGSGKTRFAGFLSKKHGIPRYDLDDLQWDNAAGEYGVKMPCERRNELLQQILSRQDWIIEGVYFSWVKQGFAEADKIYVLDLPALLCTKRIILRAFKRKLTLEQGKKETIGSVYRLLKWSSAYRKESLPKIRRLMEPYGGKVVWISNKRELRELMSRAQKTEALK